MPRYRHELPQLSDDLFLTDGGLGTTLAYHEGLDLPEFASFVLLDDEAGRKILRNYFRRYAEIAKKYQVGFIFESMTWRAGCEWGAKIGYSPAQMEGFNRLGIQLLEGIRKEYEGEIPHMVVSGCVGPRCEGYAVGDAMTVDEAEAYHRPHLRIFQETKADMVDAQTIPSIAEGLGIANAGKSLDLPTAISFTVETDGRLPSGERLKDAVEQIDTATDASPAYYMINCAHPSHFSHLFDNGEWTNRIQGIRANASMKSHAELCMATELDSGDPQDLAARYLSLRAMLRNFNIIGGCCGTDYRHIEEMCRAFVK
jgi:S-methylmethionine-dependent homocysteine/selenocysteine methylase